MKFCTIKQLENNLNTTMEWYFANENMVNRWTDCGFSMKKYSKSSRQQLPWVATCPLNHAPVVVFQLYVSRNPVPPFFGCAMSKGKDSFAFAISLSTQAKLQMNFQVNLLMKNNPLYINDSNDINNSPTTTQIQKHCLNHLLVISVLNNSKMSCLLNRLFQFFF
jgi:hypothetical protein